MTLSRSSSSRAFTLLEMLAVITVITIMVAIAAPAMKNMVQPSQLTVGVQMFNDQLNLARQESQTRNRQVQIRFYKLPVAGTSGKEYRAIRLFLFNEYGTTATPLGKLVYLPTGVSLIDDANHSRFSGLTPSTTPETIPGLGTVDYSYFSYRPNGSTTLDSTASAGWFWTFRNQNDALLSSGLPANYATLQLDPITGRTRLFRP